METKWSKFYPEELRDFPVDTEDTLYTCMRSACEKFGKRTAYQFFLRRFSYQEFIKQIDLAADGWYQLGVRPGDKVLICMGGCPQVFISVYALDKIGATSVLCIPDEQPDNLLKLSDALRARFALMSRNQAANYSEILERSTVEKLVIGRYYDYLDFVSNLYYSFSDLSVYDNARIVKLKTTYVYWSDIMYKATREHAPLNTDNIHDAVCFVPNTSKENAVCTAFSSKALVLSSRANSFIHSEREKKLGRPSRVLCLNEHAFVFTFTIGMNDVLITGQTYIIFTWYNVDNIVYATRVSKPDTLVAYTGTAAKFNGYAVSPQVLKKVTALITGEGLFTAAQKAGLIDISESARGKLDFYHVSGSEETAGYAYVSPDTLSDRSMGIPLPGTIMKAVDRSSLMDARAGSTGELAVYNHSFCNANILEDGERESPYVKLQDGRRWYFTGVIGKENPDGSFLKYGFVSNEYKINSTPVYPERVDKTIALIRGVMDVRSIVINDIKGPLLISEVVPHESYFYNTDLLESLEKRIREECSAMLPAAMNPSEIHFAAKLPVDSKGRTDYASLEERARRNHELLAGEIEEDN